MSQHVHQEANELHVQAARLQKLLRQLDEQGSLVVDFTAIWHVLLEMNLKLRAICEGHERQLQGATAGTAGQAIRGTPAESQASRTEDLARQVSALSACADSAENAIDQLTQRHDNLAADMRREFDRLRKEVNELGRFVDRARIFFNQESNL